MTEPADLDPDTHPDATAEGDLGTVTDDEYFAALPAADLIDADTGEPVDAAEGVRDERPPQ